MFAWPETFGEYAGASVAYYLATASEQIWLQPSGDLGLTGVDVEATFLAERGSARRCRPASADGDTR